MFNVKIRKRLKRTYLEKLSCKYSTKKIKIILNNKNQVILIEYLQYCIVSIII